MVRILDPFPVCLVKHNFLFIANQGIIPWSIILFCFRDLGISCSLRTRSTTNIRYAQDNVKYLGVWGMRSWFLWDLVTILVVLLGLLFLSSEDLFKMPFAKEIADLLS